MFQGRGGDSVAIVAAYENDRTRTGGGDVEAGVEVAFTGSTFPEVAGDDAGWDVRVLEGLKFERVGCSRGLGDLGC